MKTEEPLKSSFPSFWQSFQFSVVTFSLNYQWWLINRPSFTKNNYFDDFLAHFLMNYRKTRQGIKSIGVKTRARFGRSKLNQSVNSFPDRSCSINHEITCTINRMKHSRMTPDSENHVMLKILFWKMTKWNKKYDFSWIWFF